MTEANGQFSLQHTQSSHHVGKTNTTTMEESQLRRMNCDEIVEIILKDSVTEDALIEFMPHFHATGIFSEYSNISRNERQRRKLKRKRSPSRYSPSIPEFFTGTLESMFYSEVGSLIKDGKRRQLVDYVTTTLSTKERPSESMHAMTLCLAICQLSKDARAENQNAVGFWLEELLQLARTPEGKRSLFDAPRFDPSSVPNRYVDELRLCCREILDGLLGSADKSAELLAALLLQMRDILPENDSRDDWELLTLEDLCFICMLHIHHPHTSKGVLYFLKDRELTSDEYRCLNTYYDFFDMSSEFFIPMVHFTARTTTFDGYENEAEDYFWDVPRVVADATKLASDSPGIFPLIEPAWQQYLLFRIIDEENLLKWSQAVILNSAIAHYLSNVNMKIDERPDYYDYFPEALPPIPEETSEDRYRYKHVARQLNIQLCFVAMTGKVCVKIHRNEYAPISAIADLDDCMRERLSCITSIGDGLIRWLSIVAAIYHRSQCLLFPQHHLNFKSYICNLWTLACVSDTYPMRTEGCPFYFVPELSHPCCDQEDVSTTEQETVNDIGILVTRQVFDWKCVPIGDETRESCPYHTNDEPYDECHLDPFRDVERCCRNERLIRRTAAALLSLLPDCDNVEDRLRSDFVPYNGLKEAGMKMQFKKWVEEAR